MRLKLRTEIGSDLFGTSLNGWDAAIYLVNYDNFYICPDECDRIMLWHSCGAETRKQVAQEAREARAKIVKKLRNIR